MPAEDSVDGPKRGGSQSTALAVMTSSAALQGRADMAEQGSTVAAHQLFFWSNSFFFGWSNFDEVKQDLHL